MSPIRSAESLPDTDASGIGRVLRWRVLWPIISAVCAGIALIFIWRLAADAGSGVCIAIYPAPPGCAPEDRFPAAVIASVVLGLSWLASLTPVLSRRVPPWAGLIAATVTVIAAFIAYGVVLYA